MNLQTRIQRSESALSSPIADELVMFDTEAGKYYGMNDIATDIWECLKQPVTVEELCDSLTDEFDVSPEQCRKDVLDFVTVLKEKDLVKVVER